ncbi:extracellular solute-binding protein [Streptobacillus felis]|uniref:Extracellular solute-binding protein n=1 Tax=Streptobacillus felis TaxID=1384509 RepID=A0A7Z0PFP1_9FUSO|nr:extracellular solute-binding protein [Streptobacillus felis]NYV28347.1 extracellular solute-binding protein [Streptobacillus felis]
MNKKFKMLAATAALALTAFSCGAKEEAKTEGPVTIKYWSFPNFTADPEFQTPEEFDAALIKAFEEANPGIKVEYQKIDFTDGPAKLETAIQSKSTPDVVIDAPGRVIDWAKKGYLVPFEADTSVYSPSMVSAASYDGKLYLYPLGTTPFVMAFNKVITDKLGLTDMLPLNKPGRNWTVAEFEALLTAIKEKEPSIDPILFYTKSQAGDQGPRAFVSNLFDSWITDKEVSKYTINDENGVKGLEWIKQAYDKGLLGQGVSAEAKDALEAFRSGNAAGTILYSPGLKGVKADQEAVAAGKLDPVFVAFPNESGQAKFEFLLAGAAIFDNEDAARAEAAKKFVDFIANDPVWGERALKATRNFSPVGKGGIYGDDAESKFLEEQSGNFGPYYNTIDGYAQMRPLWFNMVQSVLNGQVSAKEALDKFAEDANKTIEDAK